MKHFVLESLHWTQKTFCRFPLDPVRQNSVRSNVRGAVFSEVAPTPLSTPVQLACWSRDALTSCLDLEPADQVVQQQEFLQLVSGNRLPPGCIPLAHRYGGHQFGSWAGQLGDGRAHLIGEYTNRRGERWELQLKGSGMTPYSRFADGRAVIRSSVREFLASEAMHHLGVPTSRAATLVVSDDPVVRDQFYDGRPRRERAAVLLRLAPSWFRFGSLQMLTADGDTDSLRLVTDHLVSEHYPGVLAEETEGGEGRYGALLQKVAARTGRLVASWQALGFTHGVMNTDNMSLLGITIDYGPFGFMERYNPTYVANTSDHWGAYKFVNQPRVAQWNLCRLYEALMPLLPAEEEEEHSARLRRLLDTFLQVYQCRHGELLSAKLGLAVSGVAVGLADRLLALMHQAGADFSATFRQLGETELASLLRPGWPAQPAARPLWALRQLAESPAAGEEFHNWLGQYRAELAAQGREDEAGRQSDMCATNPRYVLRNWLAQRAIEAAEQSEFSELRRLQRVLTRPYTEQPEAEELGYAAPPPDWAQSLHVSCSS